MKKESLFIEITSNIEELSEALKRASELAAQLVKEIKKINGFELEIGTRSTKS
jgi:hypothetical protein